MKVGFKRVYISRTCFPDVKFELLVLNQNEIHVVIEVCYRKTLQIICISYMCLATIKCFCVIAIVYFVKFYSCFAFNIVKYLIFAVEKHFYPCAQSVVLVGGYLVVIQSR